MKNVITRRLDSESFGVEGRHFFVDLMKAKNDKPYLQITRANYKNEKFYERSSVILFEEDFGFLIEALSMVLTRYTHGEHGKY
jgi:DNA repair protein RadC